MPKKISRVSCAINFPSNSNRVTFALKLTNSNTILSLLQIVFQTEIEFCKKYFWTLKEVFLRMSDDQNLNDFQAVLHALIKSRTRVKTHSKKKG